MNILNELNWISEESHEDHPLNGVNNNSACYITRRVILLIGKTESKMVSMRSYNGRSMRGVEWHRPWRMPLNLFLQRSVLPSPVPPPPSFQIICISSVCRTIQFSSREPRATQPLYLKICWLDNSQIQMLWTTVILLQVSTLSGQR
jgi:hypothetical protein